MGVIRSVLYVATLFGLKLTAEQMAGLVLAVEAITTAITRQSVTPNSKLPKDPPTEAGAPPTPRSGKLPPPTLAACFSLLALFVGCSSSAPAIRAPTAEELERACPEALKIATVDCPALAVASCRGFESLDECPAGASVRAECSRLREEALSRCQ